MTNEGVKPGNIIDFLKPHADDCELRQMPTTMCTAMAMFPEQYGMNRVYKCTCGIGGEIFPMTSTNARQVSGITFKKDRSNDK